MFVKQKKSKFAFKIGFLHLALLLTHLCTLFVYLLSHNLVLTYSHLSFHYTICFISFPVPKLIVLLTKSYSTKCLQFALMWSVYLIKLLLKKRLFTNFLKLILLLFFPILLSLVPAANTKQ